MNVALYRMAKRKKTSNVNNELEGKLSKSNICSSGNSKSKIKEEQPSALSVSIITLKHSRAAISLVKDFPDVKMYDTNTKGKFVYVPKSRNLKVSNPNNARVIPILRQLEYIADNMKSNVVELKWDSGPSEFYDSVGVSRLREILLCKVVKDSMENGMQFIFNCRILDSQEFLSPISQKCIHEFWDIIGQASPDEKLTMNGLNVASESLFSLMSPESPLSQEVVDQVCCILNKDSQSHRCIVTSVHKMNECLSSFITEVKQLFGDSLFNVNVLLYMNVDESCTAAGRRHQHHVQSQQHYVFGIYSLDENKVLHVDTLAKPVPKLLFTSFVELANRLGKKEIYFGACHEEKAVLDHTKCRLDCLYPYQRCSSLGGMAVIIGMCIYVLDRQIFKVMTGENVHKEYMNRVHYLKDISLHSQFLKLVIINWIVIGVIDLCLIYKKVSSLQKDSPQKSIVFSESMGDENHGNESHFAEAAEPVEGCSFSEYKHFTETSSWTTKNSAFDSLSDGDVSLDKDENLGIDSNEHTENLTHNVDATESVTPTPYENIELRGSLLCKCHRSCNSQNVVFINSGKRKHIICYNEIQHLLSSPPKVCYKAKQKSYCVQCCLANEKLKKYAFFRCSNSERDDENILKEIQEFFTETKFLQWMNGNNKHSIVDQRITLCSMPQETMNELDNLCDNFHPDVTIVLDENFDMPVESETFRTSTDKTFKDDVSKGSESYASSPKSVPEEILTRDAYSHSPMKFTDNFNEEPKFSLANTIRVGCKHGRIPVYFGEVQHLLIGRPTIAFRRDRHYSLECTFYNGAKGYKNFFCNKNKGREDLDALKTISEFLKLENFQPWVKEVIKSKHKNKRGRGKKGRYHRYGKSSECANDMKICNVIPQCENIVVKNEDIEDEAVHISVEINDMGEVNRHVNFSSKVKVDDSVKVQDFDYERIKKHIVGKPKIHYRKSKNIYSVECLLWNGNKVYKKFPCLSSRWKTLEEIKIFFRSDEALTWVQNDDQSWIFQYEVKAGAETKNCLDKIPFDLTRHFVYDKSIVKPQYSKDTSWVSVTENKKWGKTHRYDETYQKISSSANCNPNTVIAYVYLNCASKTNECRSVCGALLSSLMCHGNICSNCGFSLATGRECSHCKTTTSSQWYHKGEPRELCATCYTYKLRKGCDRPVEFRAKADKPPSKIYHEHLQCRWRMKLEMKLGNMNVWNVYESKENSNYHVDLPIQENKKPSLGVRDKWDKLRLSQKATSLQIHNIESKNKTELIVKEETGAQVMHPLSQIKARCELVNKRQSKKKIDEPCEMIVSEEYQVDNVTEIELPQNDKVGQKQLHIETVEPSHNRICGICFEEGINPPFTCCTKRELDAHKNKVHNACGDLCAICYKEMGMVVRFEDSRELMQHLSKHKVKYR